MNETKSTSEVAALLKVAPNLVRQIARRRKIKAVGRDLVTGEAMWPADRIIEMIPRRYARRKP